MENHPKRLWKSIKRNMHEIKGFDTRLRGSIHYESLSHIRLQATHKNHISWMARSSNKEPTLSSLPLTKSTSKWKSTPPCKPKRWLPNQPLLLYVEPLH
jgi:hypothetical protein